jgi:Holliday junction resolvase
MGRMQRDKGARGERSICAVDAEHGFESVRSAPMQCGHGDDDFADVWSKQWPMSLLFREVKNYKRTPVNAFTAEYVVPDRAGYLPVLVWKDERMPWIANLKYVDLVKILGLLRDTKAELGELKMQMRNEADGRAA